MDYPVLDSAGFPFIHPPMPCLRATRARNLKASNDGRWPIQARLWLEWGSSIVGRQQAMAMGTQGKEASRPGMHQTQVAKARPRPPAPLISETLPRFRRRTAHRPYSGWGLAAAKLQPIVQKGANGNSCPAYRLRREEFANWDSAGGPFKPDFGLSG